MLEEKDYSKQELADALYAGNIKPASRMKKLWRELSKAEMQNISDALLVERILNDGTLDDYRELVSTLGGKRVAEVLFLDTMSAHYIHALTRKFQCTTP